MLLSNAIEIKKSIISMQSASHGRFSLRTILFSNKIVTISKWESAMKHIFNALNYHQIGRLQESFIKQQTLDHRRRNIQQKHILQPHCNKTVLKWIMATLTKSHRASALTPKQTAKRKNDQTTIRFESKALPFVLWL